MYLISTDIYESGDYSDLTVICGGDVYKVHKAIICPRSDFFSKACRDKAWKVLRPVTERSFIKEGEAGQVTLQQETLLRRIKNPN